MPKTVHLCLPDELHAFIDQNGGNGMPYATPSDFIRDMIRKRKRHVEATVAREAIIGGYQDAIARRMHAFQGNLRSLLGEVRGARQTP